MKVDVLIVTIKRFVKKRNELEDIKLNNSKSNVFLHF